MTHHDETPTLREDMGKVIGAALLGAHSSHLEGPAERLKDALSIMEACAKAVRHLPTTQAARDVLTECRHQVESPTEIFPETISETRKFFSAYPIMERRVAMVMMAALLLKEIEAMDCQEAKG